MDEWTGFVDDARGVLRMSGPDTRAVLQDVVTNDVDAVTGDRVVYAALLTPQGKYLFDFFLVGDGDDILIDTGTDRAGDLARRLTMYAIRRETRVAPEPDLRVMAVWPRAGGEEGSPSAPPHRSDGVIVVPDPRDARLGWRLYGANPPGSAPMGASGNVAENVMGANRADYDALRVALAIPETGRELLADETYILEAGFERLNGVDFRKGCYVGQEVTARMKHKTDLRKGLATVAVEGEAPEGAELTTEDGKPAGRLFTQANGQGLAHLRFDRARGALRAGAAVVRYDPAARSAASPSR